MVGLVIVSHSRALASALVNLIQQVSVENIPIAIAAGVGQDNSEFGTDAVEIMEAIQSVHSDDGVIVMMDLGSAVLSSQMALELMGIEESKDILFCSAPLVEGCIAAAVQIGLGNDLQTVCEEAMQALQSKNEQLGINQQTQEPAAARSEVSTGPVEQRILTLVNLHGLHARPVARFIKTASSFNADIKVKNLTNQKGPVSAKSLNALTTLGAVKDHQIEISASGPEARQALDALEEMVVNGFYETEQTAPITKEVSAPAGAEPVKTTEAAHIFRGAAVSDGIALGPLFHFSHKVPEFSKEKTSNPHKELEHLQQAMQNVARAIQKRRQQLQASLDEEQASIFDAHLLILQDPDIQEQVQQIILSEKENASSAWHRVIEQVVNSYQSLPDEYLQQRAIDVQDVGNQVLWELTGDVKSAIPQFDHPVILFSENITPTDTAQFDMEQVKAIITVGGGTTSHAAILARGLGIPAIAGASPAIGNLKEGTTIAVDGFSGDIWVEPIDNKKEELLGRRQKWQETRQRLLSSSHELARLKDGRRIEIAANIGNLSDAAAAMKNGAEGVGLLRTEFLFLSRQTPPTEDEQYETLCQIGSQMSGRPVIVRTLDVGGDKELPYIDMPVEDNPFLGVRAIRLSLQQPDLFMQQLRAILRASEKHPFRIMFPMVANLDELLQGKTYLEKAHRELESKNIPHRYPIETGIMIEIPSAALLSNVLAPHVDFFSIGTNDLTQYTLAAERGNPSLNQLSDAMHPAVLRLIQNVAESAHKHQKWVGVCGELAGDIEAVPILIGLGVDELSMNPGSIPRVKNLLKKIDSKTIQNLTSKVLTTDGAPAARRIVREEFSFDES